MSASCFHKRILFLCFSHITSKTCESVAPGFTQPSYSFLSCSSVIATTIHLISWGMFTTVPHLSAGGLVKGKDAQLSPLLFWRCSRIINVIQQRLSLFFCSSVVVSSHRQLLTLLSARNASHVYPWENTLFPNLQPIDTPYQFVVFWSG